MFDSDFVINLLNGNNDLTQFIGSDYEIFISSITWMEVIAGARNKIHLSSIKKALANFSVIPLDIEISELANKIFEKYFLSHGLQINDCFIAATAIRYEVNFYTFNQKDFRFISGLNLIIHGLKPMPRQRMS